MSGVIFSVFSLKLECVNKLLNDSYLLGCHSEQQELDAVATEAARSWRSATLLLSTTTQKI